MKLRLPFQSKKKDENAIPDNRTTILEDRWSTFICLTGLFVIAFFIRSYFALEMSTKYGTPFMITGGSDAYYYERIVEYIANNNRHLLFDPMINYPMGVRNPRPPMYGWTTVLSAYLITPFIGDFTTSLHYSFILSTPFWGALTVFPVYLVGRDIFGKKAGMAAAFLLAISAGHLQRSPIGNGDHDALYLFFAIGGFYFLMKALKGIPDDVSWVESWGDRDLIKKGVSTFIQQNKKPLLYAAMAGMCFATVALSWQGWAYVVIIVLTYYYVQLFLDRVRYRDSLGVTACVMISLIISVTLAAPYYLSANVGTNLPHGIGTWFDVPLLIIIGGLLGGMILTVSRDYPWVFIFSIMAVAVVGILLYSIFVNPMLLEAITSGAGYFTQKKTTETIAEAQAPEFSNLVLSFGPVTFFLSIIGIVFAIWHLKGRWDTQFLFILIWTAFAIYMAISAARFIFNGSPAFALTAGWIIALLIDKSNFQNIARRFKNFRGDFFGALKRGVTVTHVLSVLFIVFLLLMPNVLSAFDAGIPFESKREYDRQVHRSLPSFLKPDDYNETTGEVWHLGAFGYGVDKPTDYWPASWDWLKEQNDHLPPEKRPAFLSWWDYGFECVQRGKTPTVADNFLWGHRLAGNVLMAQNESEVISLLIVRILEEPFSKDGALEGEVRNILERHIGEEKSSDLEHALVDPGSYREEVLSNPDRYHPRADDISNGNLKYARTMGLLSYEEHETLVELYYDLTKEQDKMIQYLAVDTRLFPFSGRQTGIFYAPAKLSDHRIDEEGGMRSPYDFYTITLVDEQGNHYEDPEAIPPGVNIVDYGIDYKPMFYNSMLYRIFVGYAGHWVGEEESIPTVENQELQPMPGWNLNNFRLSYRTAYYNPYPEEEVRNHPDEWRAISFQEAIEYHEAGEGTVDMSPTTYLRQGVVYLEYYHGAIVSGTVETEEGEPISGARITIIDETGTPHGTVFTDEEGHYRTYAPFGELTLVASTGGEDNMLHQMEAINLGMSSFNVSREQAMRKRVDRTGDGKWDYLIEKNIEVATGSISGNVFIDIDGTNEYSPQNDTLVPANVTVVNQHLDLELYSGPTDGFYEFANLVPGIYTITTDVEGATTARDITVEQGDMVTNDIRVSTGSIYGKATFDDVEESVEVEARHIQTDKAFTTVMDDEGNYTIPHLIPGKYSIGVTNENYTLSTGRITIELDNNEEFQLNLTLSKAVKIWGQTRLSGRPIPYQRLTFTSTEVAVALTATSDSEGNYAIKVPYGEYMIYGTYHKNEERYAFMDRTIIPSSDPEINANFNKAYRVSGNVEHEGDSLEGFAILFSKDESQIMVPTNPDGDFSVILPEGKYTVYGWKATTEITTVHRSIITVHNNMDLDIKPKLGRTLEGNVYRELVDSEDTGIPASVILSFQDQISVTIRTGREGDYRVVVPRDETTTLTFEAQGYLSKEISYHPDREIEDEISLRARNLTVAGSINYFHKMPEELPLIFEYIGNGAIRKETTISGSGYSADIQPGDYRMVIDHSPSEGELYSFVKNISIIPGESVDEIDIDVDYRVEIKIELNDVEGDHVSAEMEFIGPETKSIFINETGELYLKPGAYVLWAANENEKIVNMSNLQVSDPAELEIVLEEGLTFSPFVTYENEEYSDIPVWILNLDTGHLFNRTTDTEGRFSILLPVGNYEVYIEYEMMERIDGVLRNVLYTYSQTYDMVTSTSPAIQMERDLIHPTLTGSVEIEGEGVGNIVVEFTENSPEAISTSTTTDAQGNFELDISHGLYTVYTYYTGPKGLHAEMYEFLMPEEDHHLDISLRDASILSGVVRKDGEGVPAEITITSLDYEGQTEFAAGEDGNYELILPSGRYEIIASIIVLENNVDTTYRYERELDLRYSMELNINLERVATYGVRLHDVEERETKPGKTLVFRVPVENTGNSEDEYEFSAPTAIWPLEFEPTRLKVPAGETVEVEVSVDLDENASVNHPPINFVAESVNSIKQDSMKLPISVIQHYGVRIDTEADKNLDRGVVTYIVGIENTGNGDDIYDIDILNKDYLKANGWDVSVTNRTESITDGGVGEVTITMRATTSRPGARLTVKLEAVSQGDPSVSSTEEFEILSPTITSDLTGFRILGEDLSLEEQIFRVSTGQWAALVIVAIIGGFYIVKKRRWL